MDDKVVKKGNLLPGIKRLSRVLHWQSLRKKKLHIFSRFSLFGCVTAISPGISSYSHSWSFMSSGRRGNSRAVASGGQGGTAAPLDLLSQNKSSLWMDFLSLDSVILIVVNCNCLPFHADEKLFGLRCVQMVSKRKQLKPCSIAIFPGAPNENIAQNHLNIALLNVFQYLNGIYTHILIP